MSLTVANERCDDCRGQCDAGKPCPRAVKHTEPGELAPEREKRPVQGAGLVLAVLLVLGVLSLGLALSMATSGVQP